VLQACYLLHLLQAGLKKSPKRVELKEEKTLGDYLKACGVTDLEKEALSFVRFAAVLFQVLGWIPAQPMKILYGNDLQSLCSLLSLPSIAETLASVPSKAFADILKPDQKLGFGIENGRAPEMAALPNDFQEVFSSIRPDTGKATCLICGKCLPIKCVENEPLNPVLLHHHARTCNNGNGLFFLDRPTIFVATTSSLLHPNGNMPLFIPLRSPYVDEHGYEDTYLHRGNALTLNADRTQEYLEILLSNGIPDRIFKAMRFKFANMLLVQQMNALPEDDEDEEENAE